jgi:2-polyprenyl-6-methoxyphenol hydroxylase-like FAD-dependent oxidoreductase
LKHAIVIGGGIAGLLAAHVVSPYFSRVTIVDHDAFPTAPNPRRGVPQGRHMHILMAAGRLGFEKLLPGIGTQLALAGARILDFAEDSRLWFSAGWMTRFRSGIEAIACTRDLLEWVLRKRVMVNDRIHTLVEGLLSTSDRRTITGVRLANGTLEADLVVDTSGRGSRAPQWLEALGCSAVPETVVDAPIHYASCWYELRDDPARDFRLMAVSPRYPDIRKSGTIYQVEDRRWNVLLLGLDGEEVPDDRDGFVEFAAQLATPAIYEAIEGARPLSPIYRYRNNQNRLRHYEQVDDAPARFVVLGDAACALNPYYGLGMTAATRSAEELQTALRLADARDDWTDFARHFHARLAVVHRGAW